MKIFYGLLFLAMPGIASSQTVLGSVQKGSAANKVDVVYLPDHNSSGGEYVNYLSVSIAIPTALASGVVPTIASAGIFSPTISFSQATPFSYTSGTETIYSWTCSNNTSFAMSWSNGVSFVGATITLVGGSGNTPVRMVDGTNMTPSGGNNGNTFFNVGVNIAPFDLTDYTNFFFAIGGLNGSTVGAYPSGDKYVETNASISLPASLSSFSGYKNGSKNTLNWTVSSESNNKGFDVLRSIDGVNYLSIGFVNSKVAGNSATEVQYGFDDQSPQGKKQYYRLSQVDLDGKSKLSNIITVSRERTSVLTIAGLFPNPVREQVNLAVETPGRDQLVIVVTDLLGRVVSQQTAAVETGSNTLPLDVRSLARGQYVVKLVSRIAPAAVPTMQFTKE